MPLKAGTSNEPLPLDEQEKQHIEIISYCRRRLPWVWIRNRVGGGLILLATMLLPIGIASPIVDVMDLERASFASAVIFVAAYGGFVWFIATHDRFNKWITGLANEEKELRETIHAYRSSLGMIRAIRGTRTHAI